MTGLLRILYHSFLKVVLRGVGLDFGWYLDFYRKWPYALSPIEVCLQRLRPRGRSRRFFAGYNIERFAEPGDVVLDIGANIGDVSSHLLRLGYRVDAYEPDPRCAEFLRRRFSRVGKDRFRLHEQAVSDRDGETTLFFGRLTSESSSILERNPGTVNTGGHQVDVRSIAGILESRGYVPLIMMDIEGAEYGVLEQMLTPQHQQRFGLCVAESHAGKMPELQARHQRILRLVDRYGLEDRIRLDWH